MQGQERGFQAAQPHNQLGGKMEQNSGYEQLRAETALPTPHPTSCLRRGSEGRRGIQLRKADNKSAVLGHFPLVVTMGQVSHCG